MKEIQYVLHKSFHRIALSALLVSLLIPLCILAEDDKSEWPGWRGKNFDAVAGLDGMLGGNSDVGLKVVWRETLGSGYSSVSVVDKRAITMYSDGQRDKLIAFDANSGKKLWEYDIDETYRGHDGSHDGPISTPFIHEETVFGLSPRGMLVAVNAETGAKIWSVNIVENYKAPKPHYGFSTSPIVVNNTLLVEMGGKEKNSIAGFKPESGELLWSTGEDAVTYQSPMLIDLDGQPQILFSGNRFLYGLDPQDGSILWEYNHGGDGAPPGSGVLTPVRMDGNQFFLAHKFREGMVVNIQKGSDNYQFEEVWTSGNLKQTYSTPVYHDGYLFGYKGRLFQCVDGATGKVVWRSRTPGDGFPMLLDGHLAVLTKKGALHIAKASPDGYQEVAAMQLFDDHTWSPISVANGMIYARSFKEITALKIENLSKQLAQGDLKLAGQLPDSKFAKWVKQVEAAENKKTMIDNFMSRQADFPIIEGDNQAHIIYRGEVKDIVISGDMISSRNEDPMNRIEGTDFYYYSFELDPAARIDYRFIRDFEDQVADPLNKRVGKTIGIDNSPAETSWLAMPKWKSPAHLAEQADGARGTVDSLSFDSEAMGDTRSAKVYLPPGYADSDKGYPVVYYHDGFMAEFSGNVPNSLDNLIGEQIAPVIAVFIQPGKNVRAEYRGGLVTKYSKMFLDELIPLIDETYRTQATPEARLSIGTGASASAVLYSAFSNYGSVTNLSLQTVPALDFYINMLDQMIKGIDEQPARIYLDWGKYDIRAAHEGWDMRDLNARLGKMLEKKGYEVAGGEFVDGSGWLSWRNRTDVILKHFFPANAGG